MSPHVESVASQSQRVSQTIDFAARGPSYQPTRSVGMTWVRSRWPTPRIVQIWTSSYGIIAHGPSEALEIPLRFTAPIPLGPGDLIEVRTVEGQPIDLAEHEEWFFGGTYIERREP